MDALLTSMFAVALAEMGDRPQILCAALAMRFGNNRPVMMGLALATAINCLISAIGGVAVNGWISEDPVKMFYALSLIFAGLGMVMWRRPVDLLDGWTLGAFATSFLGLFILQLGDKAQFIVAATSARTDQWLLAALGGWIGIMAACVPALLMREKLAEILPLRALRLGGGFLLLFIGAIVATSALRLW